MNLSNKAIEDLKIALKDSYSADFVNNLSKDDLQEIGMVLLIITAEHLKIKTCTP